MKENSYVFGSLQYLSTGISLTRNSMNTQVWRQLHVQMLRKLRGGKFQTFWRLTDSGIPPQSYYYQKHYDFTKKVTAKAQQTVILPDPGCKTSESFPRRQTTAVCSLSSEQCLCICVQCKVP